MKGVICRRHVITHPLTTIRCFGWRVFFRVIAAGPDETFLSIVSPALITAPVPPSISKLIESCVALELRAAELYRQLTLQFEDTPEMAKFFQTLGKQEEGHAQLLELCRGLADESCWREEEVARWRDAVPRLESQMTRLEGGLHRVTEPTEILQQVIDIEGSEINSLFRGVVAATDNEFVRSFKAFQTAEEEHLDYICREIPRLEVSLAGACDELRARHR